MSSSNSCEVCGWMAAFGSALAFGTFAVPIKSNVARSVNIDPLVFQSYKTGMCFLTSWLILLTGQKFVFTPWGIVSGLFWVPSGVATVYAVKTIGLGLGIGISSSMIVLVSFSWGIFVFKEPIHSVFFACIAIFAMILGLLGMSYYSASAPSTYHGDDVEMSMPLHHHSSSRTSHEGERVHVSSESVNGIDARPSVLKHCKSFDPSNKSLRFIDVYGIPVSKRHLGMMAAAFCGLWGGSIMAPMKFSKADTNGTHYLLSFAIGASIVNLGLWLLRYVYCVVHYRNFRVAYNLLPSFHLRKMWWMGGIAGLLWSIGNFFSLISVFYLGEGVGYPLVQTSILISGLWGLFYFKEVKGSDRISRWLLSSLLTVFGILLLSYEHHVK